MSNRPSFEVIEKSTKAFCVILIIYIIATWLLSGCTVAKKNQSASNKTLQTAKSDSGKVSYFQSTTQSEFDYEKITKLFNSSHSKADSPIINVYPTTIIQERFKSQQQQQINTKDSTWKSAFDSLSKVLKTQNAQSKTEVLSPIQIIGLAAIIFFAGQLLLKLLSGISISLKNNKPSGNQ